MPPMPTVSSFFVFSLFRLFCSLFWHIWGSCGLLWPFDDVKTQQGENTAKHCKPHRRTASFSDCLINRLYATLFQTNKRDQNAIGGDCQQNIQFNITKTDGSDTDEIM